MKYWWPLRIVRFLVFAAAVLIIVGFAVMLLWNALVPDLFKGPVITYWQAVGLLVLSHILLRGWGRWHYSNGWRHRRWRHRIEERMAAMTPEEREKYREEWRKRCGWYPGEESEKTSTSKA
jgi:hypothetical protein